MKQRTHCKADGQRNKLRYNQTDKEPGRHGNGKTTT